MTVDSSEQRAWLEALSARFSPDMAEEVSPDQRRAFDLATREGTDFYRSLTDEDLLTALRQAAARLGHSPAQREVFWVWRTYLRQRFGKWPAALQAAGLSRSAGAGGVSLARMEEDFQATRALLDQVAQAAKALGRVPHPGDLPQVCRSLGRKYATWGEVLSAAGVRREQTVRKLEGLDEETLVQLAALKETAMALGRAPLRSEVEDPLRAALTAACGSWRNALYQIGLEPVIHITPFAGARLGGEVPRRKHGTALHDCYYRVLNLGQADRARLEEVRALSQRLGRSPKRGEVPTELRKALQAACGSWSNALFQLGLEEKKNQ